LIKSFTAPLADASFHQPTIRLAARCSAIQFDHDFAASGLKSSLHPDLAAHHHSFLTDMACNLL
jgi:hypothetical protein